MLKEKWGSIKIVRLGARLTRIRRRQKGSDPEKGLTKQVVPINTLKISVPEGYMSLRDAMKIWGEDYHKNSIVLNKPPYIDIPYIQGKAGMRLYKISDIETFMATPIDPAIVKRYKIKRK